MDHNQRLGAILRALDIIEIEYTLNGSGDSGETDLERVQYRGGRPETSTLPDIPIFITDGGAILSLPNLLHRIVADAPDGDWVNNEGGYGTVYVRPFEDEGDPFVECNMTYREDGDYGDGDGDDYDDEDEFVDDGLSEAETRIDVAVPLIVVGEVAS
ncbi:hypothetical protein [Neoaquamicrobium sediminum]|uniref:hypothetical protein n=1 Tax=Neoaquamicrobium sediminum TaxID=1849104 RepID=UPI001563DF2A|nr:hypothetical protein [Mesorhizobium sediminum]NRC57316.1 hypothetical protein [Mesorhizobium sediminum]